MSAALAFSHGANDAQKSVGVIAALLLADGRIDYALGADLGDRRLRASALTVGTALGGWRIIRTVGRRIYRIQPIEGLASQTASSAVILGASLIGGAGVDDTGRRLLDRRGRRRAPAPRITSTGWSFARWRSPGSITIPAARLLGGGRLRGLAGGRMKPGRWFLPETPDVLGLLRAQIAVTLEGLDAFAAWAGGDAGAGAARARRRAPRRRGRSASCSTRCARPSSLRSSPRTCSRSRAGSTGSSTSRAT